MTTYDLFAGTSSGPSTSSPADSRVSRGASPDGGAAPTTTAISGRRCAALLPLVVRDGCLQKMCLDLFARSWASPECSLTWEHWAIRPSPSAFRLRASARPTDATACGLWRTPRANDGKGGIRPDSESDRAPADFFLPDQVNYALWPTPNAGPQNDTDTKWQQRREACRERHGNNGFGLTLGMTVQTAALWPTASARDWKGAPDEPLSGNARPLNEIAKAALGPTPCGSDARTAPRGALNPAYVCWLMGYPAGWLRSVCSATR